MKKTAIIVVLIWALLVSILLPFRQKAYADPMTLSQIASIGYAFGSSFGMDFTMSGLTSTGANEYLSGMINKWLSGRTVIEAFGSEAARLTAGKLVVPSAIINGLIQFFDSFIQDNNITSETKEISYTSGNYSASFNDFYIENNTMWHSYNVTNISTGVTNVVPGSNGWGYDPAEDVGFSGFYVSGGKVYGSVWRIFRGTRLTYDTRLFNVGDTQSVVSGSLSGELPTVLNPDQEWSGTLGGQDWPDTNLDQLLGHIDDMVIDGTLDIEGEIVDPPVPPTPVPTIEPGDIDAYWNRQSEQLEGLGNDIGDISGKLDDLGQQAGDITDALEGVNEGIQTQTGVISGALDQATEDVIDAIGEQTGVLDESLTQTAEGVQEIADALQPGEIEPRQFDLRRLFPFCIPFDIHNLLQKFNAEPVAPHVQLPFVIQSIGFSYMFDLDFSAFDPVAAAMRTVEFIVFAIGLAWATSKVIKW